MKTTVTPGNSRSGKFPKLMKGGTIIILAIAEQKSYGGLSRYTGTCVHDSSKYYKVGYYADNWDEEFADFHGKVELES